MQGEDPTVADVARQRRVKVGRGSSKLPFTRLGQDLDNVFRKTFVDFPMPRNRLFLACFGVHVQVVPRPGPHKNTTRID